jgi:anti-sigma factor RsiW
VSCSNPLAFEDLVAYWAGDLPPIETDRLDEHLMSCAACSAESARVVALVNAIREMIPPVIRTDELNVLRARGLHIQENPMTPGQRRAVVFGAELDLLVHRLKGLDPARVQAAHVRIIDEQTGELLAEFPSAPFDRTTGDVLVACQRHFAAFPPNIVIEVRARHLAGAEQTASYAIPHRFEQRAAR